MIKQFIKMGFENINTVLKENNVKKMFVVCESFLENFAIKQYINSLGIEYVNFTNFKPNPLYEDVIEGLKIFNESKCDFIIAIGGGSAIDTAKCIKLFAAQKEMTFFLNQEYADSAVKMMAIPTTAGTGSEATKFSVVYYNGEKQSVVSDYTIPEYVIIEPSVLKTLPTYQKSSTLMDAFCQAIESFWSVNSTLESKDYAKEAIEIILNSWEQYMDGNEDTYAKIMLAANLSGKAINISQTTAAHAMSYKITALYNVAHGHAVALTLPQIWEYMINNIDKCIDGRGKEYLLNVFKDLDMLFGAGENEAAPKKFKRIFERVGLIRPSYLEENIEVMVNSVNKDRLKNNPVELDQQTIRMLYKNSLNKSEGESNEK